MKILSIYELEKQHQSGPENTLTSRYFGHISNLNPSTRNEILGRMGIKVEGDVDFVLWPPLGGTQHKADVRIESDDAIHILENKLDSRFTVEQLTKEYTLATGDPASKGKTVSLHCISEDYSRLSMKSNNPLLILVSINKIESEELVFRYYYNSDFL